MINAIETKNLTKKYEDYRAVDNLNLHVPQGKIYGLLGRNGAGKTTTMRMLLNLITPSNGDILLFGNNIKENKNIFKEIGSIIETPGFYGNLTGSENLEIICRLNGKFRKEKVQNALKIVGLDKEHSKKFADYSLGMKQRLGIASAVMYRPKLLILDEPINGLDPIGIREIRDYLFNLSREKNTTILISSHVLSEIEQIADIIGIMHEGKLIKEINMDELNQSNRQFAEFTISDINKACILLENNLKIKNFSILDNTTVRLYESIEKTGEINKLFNDNGLLVKKINICKENLEEYFSNLIGGNGIA